MIFYIIKWTFIYVILIFLLHNLYLFFQSNLTSTKIKDYYNTYNSESNNNNNSAQVKNIKTKKTLTHSNNLQVNSTSLEELKQYNVFNNMEFTNQEFTNHELINQEFTNQELTNNSNGLTNSMKSELNDFFNKLKL